MSMIRVAKRVALVRGAIAKFSRDRRGVSAVEFALILPLMLLLYLGGTALTQAIIVKRKVVLVTHTVGDLVARDNSITNTEVTAIFDAAKAVFAPYAWDPLLKIKVSSVRINSAGTATVAWSIALQDTAREVGSPVTLPAGLDMKDSTVVWTEVSYNFTPPIGSTFTGGVLTLTDQFYIRPRLVACITRDTGTLQGCT